MSLSTPQSSVLSPDSAKNDARPPTPSDQNRPNVRALGESLFEFGLAAMPAVILALFVALPVVLLIDRSFRSEEGAFVGLANYVRYFSSPSLLASAINSLVTASSAAAIGVSLAFFLSYALVRCRCVCPAIWRQLLLIPLYAPTMLVGLALIYLFGRQGLVTQGLFGRVPGVDIGLYGSVGIIIAGALLVVSPSLLMISSALRGIDGRFDEASRSMGAGSLRRFTAITWPAVRFAFISALLAGFVLCFTDFGAPKLVGGKTTVLPVQIYQQVVGQQNLSMGATVAVLMFVPVLICFTGRYLLNRRSVAAEVTLDGRSIPVNIRPNFVRDVLFTVLVGAASAVMGLLVLVPAFVSVIDNWPYSLSNPRAGLAAAFTTRHYDFSTTSAVGDSALTNSIVIASASAIVGTITVFLAAYAFAKVRSLAGLRNVSHVLALAPLAMPGLVIGLSYVFLFNRPDLFGVPNPLRHLYGTAFPLIVANIIHFFSVAYLTTLVSLRQQDPAFEEVGASIGVPRWRLMWGVTLPVSLPALLDVATYLFVNAMCTVSAVIFLYSPKTIIASVAVVGLDDAGEQQAAAALCVLIFAINILVAATSQCLRWWLTRRI